MCETCCFHAIFQLHFHNGLFQVRIKALPKPDNPFKSGEVLVAAINFNDPVWRMHRRLGHLSFQGMLNLKKVSTGMDVTEQQIKEKLKAICPVCATTRALVRIPRDPAKRKSEELGDLILSMFGAHTPSRVTMSPSISFS